MSEQPYHGKQLQRAFEAGRGRGSPRDRRRSRAVIAGLTLAITTTGTSGCSQEATPSRPDRIVTAADAMQAIDHLAAMVEKQDYDAAIQMFAPGRGDLDFNTGVLILHGEQAGPWLRSRRLISEAEGYYAFDLESSESFNAHQIHVHKHSTIMGAMSDEGIEF